MRISEASVHTCIFSQFFKLTFSSKNLNFRKETFNNCFAMFFSFGNRITFINRLGPKIYLQTGYRNTFLLVKLHKI